MLSHELHVLLHLYLQELVYWDALTSSDLYIIKIFMTLKHEAFQHPFQMIPAEVHLHL